ncbi:TPA: hypothetical protein N0F65_007700, partial [Lagenidium giganteum]
DAEAARIAHTLAQLEQQRAQGELLLAEQPVRLYQGRDGAFYRVLDDSVEPLTAEMIDAIHAYLHPEAMDEQSEKDDDDDARGSEDGQMDEPEQDSLGIEDPSFGVTTENGVLTAASLHEDSEGLVAGPITQTPSDLASQQTVVSRWLDNGDADDECDVECGQQFAASNASYLQERDNSIPSASPTVDDQSTLPYSAPIERRVEFASLLSDWPEHLPPRTRVLHAPETVITSSSSEDGDEPVVVYWMRCSPRVQQCNFALETAQLFSQKLDLPLVVVAVLPAKYLYPVRHALTADDAYGRLSYLDVRDKLAAAQIPFLAIAPSPSALLDAGKLGAQNHQDHSIVSVFDNLGASLVVTEEGFDAANSQELKGVQELVRARHASLAVLAVDNHSCVPVALISRSVGQSADLIKEEAFGKVHGNLLNETAASTATLLQPTICVDERWKSSSMQKLGTLSMQEVKWVVLEAEARAATLRQFSESEGLRQLEELIRTSVIDRPAIQEELQGGGVLSLLPFIRHGSLCSKHVVDAFSQAIASFPLPTNAPTRKALARLKVLRSRAIALLAKDRDYLLYVAQQSSNQFHEPVKLTDIRATNYLRPVSMALDTHWKVLPQWAKQECKFGDDGLPQHDAAPVYDPSVLEKSATGDEYWNEIQHFLVNRHYLHPLLISYWYSRIFEWSLSCRAAVAVIDALLTKCAVGSTSSPDALWMVWSHISKIAQQSQETSLSSKAFKQSLDSAIASHQELKIKSDIYPAKSSPQPMQ